MFIDEIDAIASARGQLSTYDRQLDQLLAEMDGMAQRGGVFVIGATNRPAQLDPAILRGRTRRNTTVNFTGRAAAGDLVDVVIERATSTTLGAQVGGIEATAPASSAVVAAVPVPAAATFTG